MSYSVRHAGIGLLFIIEFDMNFTFANVVVAAAVGSHWYGCGEGSI